MTLLERLQLQLQSHLPPQIPNPNHRHGATDCQPSTTGRGHQEGLAAFQRDEEVEMRVGHEGGGRGCDGSQKTGLVTVFQVTPLEQTPRQSIVPSIRAQPRDRAGAEGQDTERIVPTRRGRGDTAGEGNNQQHVLIPSCEQAGKGP